jgi:hypothetical protein
MFLFPKKAIKQRMSLKAPKIKIRNSNQAENKKQRMGCLIFEIRAIYLTGKKSFC